MCLVSVFVFKYKDVFIGSVAKWFYCCTGQRRQRLPYWAVQLVARLLEGRREGRKDAREREERKRNRERKTSHEGRDDEKKEGRTQAQTQAEAKRRRGAAAPETWAETVM